MNWIKVTPETMPPDMEPVIVTYEEDDGKRDVFLDAVWCEERNGWAFATECGYEFVNMKITHWMPTPKPAED